MISRRIAGQTSTAPAPLSVSFGARAGSGRFARDLIELTKPSIVSMCLLTTAAGIWLAPGSLGPLQLIAALVGTAMAVAAANALNMYLERDVDALMRRTRHRPLPAGRLSPFAALVTGLLLGFGGIALLWMTVNPLTALLAALALDTYVLLYTPLKRLSHRALLVGSVPGAMPALIGWTAVVGRIDLPGFVLFATMVLWQIPHFTAIALYQRDDYARADIRVLPLVVGDAAARRQALVATAILLPLSLALVPLGVTGWVYAVTAGAAGIYFFGSCRSKLTARTGLRGARQFFFSSLLYLPLLGLGMLLDKVLL